MNRRPIALALGALVAMHITAPGCGNIDVCGESGCGGAGGADLSCELLGEEGHCAPIIGGWDLSLGITVPPSAELPDCPHLADVFMARGVELTSDGSPGRNVLSCSISPWAGCNDQSLACAPLAPPFASCVLIVGEPLCPEPYPQRVVFVREDMPVTETLCCEK